MTTRAVSGWLLDTHALLWMLYGDKRLSTAAQTEINGQNQDTSVHFLAYWKGVADQIPVRIKSKFSLAMKENARW